MKPDPSPQIFDDKIALKWKGEALSSSERLSEKAVDYCIAELRYKAKVYEETGLVRVFYGDVVKSDTAIPAWLQDELKAAVSPLENVSPRRLDWHPGSDGKVLDLVHPSLFPLVYGQTRILPSQEVASLEDCISRCGEGVALPIPPQEEALIETNNVIYGNQLKNLFSRKFQWLPCEVDISGSDGAR